MPFNELRQNCGFTVRQFLKNPSWTFAVVFSLALAIGANTAIFSCVNAVLLNPFPYHNIDSLAVVWAHKNENSQVGIFPEVLRSWTKETDGIEIASQFFANDVTVGRSDAIRVSSAYVGSDVFRVLGVLPQVGRCFEPSDEGDGATKVIIVSHRFALRQFLGTTNALGQSLWVDGQSRSIVGIMPDKFFFPDYGVDVWIPAPQIQMPAIVRLKPGFSPERLRADLQIISNREMPSLPPSAKPLPAVVPLRRFLVGDSYVALWAMASCVILVLIIGCANTANLFGIRAIKREREIAIRYTLGAEPSRVVRQLLTETVLLVLVATVVGMIIAEWGMLLVRSLNLTEVPRIDEASLNGPVLIFTGLISVLTTFVFGCVSVFKLSKYNIASALKAGGTGLRPHDKRVIAQFLIIGEVALALVVLVAAGLVLNSFIRLARSQWGFRPENALMVSVKLPAEAIQNLSVRTSFVEEVFTRLGGLPDVTAVGMGFGVPVQWGGWVPSFLAVDGKLVTNDDGERELRNDGKNWSASRWTVAHGYFAALGVPILRGREFSVDDTATSEKVVVVSESLAKRLWPKQDPVGKYIQFLQITESKTVALPAMSKDGIPRVDRLDNLTLYNNFENQSRRVVGVVGDLQMFKLGYESQLPALYVDYRQPVGGSQRVTTTAKFVIRTDGEASALIRPAKSIIVAANPETVIEEIATMSEIINRSIGGGGTPEMLAVISSAYGGLALLLVVIGIYSVVSHSVTMRRSEIGIRMSLGATGTKVVAMFVYESLRLILCGVGFGIVAAWSLSDALQKFMFNIKPTDPTTYILASVIILIAGIAAAAIPAIRGSRIDPLETLRQE